jgi:acyl carrier protein
MASLAGAAGQANYVVANAFLDAVARRRRDEKLPGLSVNWAPWSEIGMGAVAGLSATFARQGIHRISPTDALARLDRPCAAQQASIGFADVDWSAHGQARGSATIDTLLSPLLAGRLGNETCRAATGASREQLAAQVLSDLAAARIEIAHRLLAMLTPLLGLSDVDARDLEPTLPTLSLSGLGLDSLTAVRLPTRIHDEFGRDIPPHLLFGDATISDVVAKVVQQIILQAIITTKEPLPEADLEVLTI